MAARDADWARFIGRLKAIDFSDAHSGFLAIAVAATRNLPAPSCQVPKPTPELRDEFVDALTVIFFFNVINRVANAFDLRPEWARVARSGVARRWMRWIMSIGLPYQMPLESDESYQMEASSNREQEPLVDYILECLRLVGVTRPPTAWRTFRHVPALERAIYQLLYVGIQYSDLASETNSAIARFVLEGDARSGSTGELATVARYILKRAIPDQSSASTLIALERSGLDSGQTLDIVVRTAVLSAATVLDHDSLEEWSGLFDCVDPS